MTAPVIAITGMRSQTVDGLRFSGYAVSEAIVAAVVRAGGLPLVLPPVPASADFNLELIDGVLIPGGRDMDPRTFRAINPHMPACWDDTDPVQDRVEVALIRRTIEQRIPLLAVCRGLQVLNVALGGTLIDDIPLNDLQHRSGFHDVSLEPGCNTAAVMGSTQVSVSSYHHQAIDRLGDGLIVVGRAPDGCIEAVEHGGSPVIAVQWHPEDNADKATEQQALFDAFVRASIPA